ncbi:hypothetical protein GLX27_003005 [Malassezia furfur]|uniref:INO80 complex subunit F domain-containing protein n=1 Tax=Malassezia furfur TaxID=55194 RepID=A0ABY8ESA8_MALFU|nr:hypothetical protein GLX27_003005 [Malassezia furfur]
MASSAANPAPTGAAPGKQKSKAYLSSVAIQSDATKYRQKYKELKRKVREIENENDKLQATTLRIKRNIQRLQLERAILYERIESEMRSLPIHEPRAPVEAAAASVPKTEDEIETDIGVELENTV